MRKIGYLAVEGPHDVAFAQRILKYLFPLEEVKEYKYLDSAMVNLVPKSFPHKGDLKKRVPVPTFLQNAHVCIAVHAAGGESEIPRTVKDSLGMLEGADVYSVGAILDTDSEKSAEIRASEFVAALNKLDIQFPSMPGTVLNNLGKKGFYILPDNNSPGTLEDILLETGEIQYKFLMDAAKHYLGTISAACVGGDYKEFNKPAGSKKALIGAVSSVLKPGKAVQNSIQDNDWVRGAALNVPSVCAFSNFMSSLFEVNA